VASSLRDQRSPPTLKFTGAQIGVQRPSGAKPTVRDCWCARLQAAAAAWLRQVVALRDCRSMVGLAQWELAPASARGRPARRRPTASGASSLAASLLPAPFALRPPLGQLQPPPSAQLSSARPTPTSSGQRWSRHELARRPLRRAQAAAPATPTSTTNSPRARLAAQTGRSVRAEVASAQIGRRSGSGREVSRQFEC